MQWSDFAWQRSRVRVSSGPLPQFPRAIEKLHPKERAGVYPRLFLHQRTINAPIEGFAPRATGLISHRRIEQQPGEP